METKNLEKVCGKWVKKIDKGEEKKQASIVSVNNEQNIISTERRCNAVSR